MKTCARQILDSLYVGSTISRRTFARLGSALSVLDFVHIVENSTRDAHGEHRQVADCFMFNTSRDVDDDAFLDCYFFIVKDELTFTVNDVVNLICFLMIVELRILNFDVMDFSCSKIGFFD